MQSKAELCKARRSFAKRPELCKARRSCVTDVPSVLQLFQVYYSCTKCVTAVQLYILLPVSKYLSDSLDILDSLGDSLDSLDKL